MTHRLALSRAAHLVGVHRSILQRMIREGELQALDGMVSTDELLRAFPQARLEDFGAFERTARIKEEAFGRRVRERTLPSQEVLAQRLFAQSQELSEVRRMLQRYHDLVELVQERLHALSPDVPAARALEGEIEEELGRVLGAESTDALAVMDDVLRIMSANVTVRPSGRDFFVEGHDTLLQAGLKAALRLNYGCGNGSCGLCKARVISGEVRRVQHHDYLLSEAERAQGYTLMCAYAPVGDVVLETLEARGPGDIPQQQIAARVRAVSPMGADTLRLHVQTPRSHRLRFLAGQAVTLGVAGGAEDLHGTYSVASCPCDDRNLIFHLGRDEADAFAARVFAGAVRANDTVSLWGPEGEFVLFGEGARDLTFVACDLGFAPVRSLVEYAFSADVAASCDVVWLATRSDGHYLANECRAWAEAFDQFRFLPLTAADPGAGVPAVLAACGESGRLRERDVYIAGPGAFVAAVEEGLRAAGADPTRLYTLTT